MLPCSIKSARSNGEDKWNDNLLDLIRVLTRTVELVSPQTSILDEVLDGPTFDVSKLTQPTEAQSKVPKTIKQRTSDAATLFGE